MKNKQSKKEIAQIKTIRTYHDDDCPNCGFPETIMIRREDTMEIIREECSKKCGWYRNIK